MDTWSDVRRLARSRHRELLKQLGGNASQYTAAALLEAAAAATKHRSRGVEADNPRLEKGDGKLDRERKVIWYNAEASANRQRFVQAHEYAHIWLETGGYACHASEIDEQESGTAGEVGGAAKVEGYNPRERAEREANVFACELLLPSDTLRAWAASGLHATEIAGQVGVDRALVLHQMSRAVLVPESLVEDAQAESANDPPGSTSTIELDASQEAAANAAGPVLVSAGPGTGKTRTLTGRIAGLVRSGVAAERVLALTFSNRASGEMRRRVTGVLGPEAHKVWMGTFHAYGLELLLKEHEAAGLPVRPTILDSVDAAALLEGALGRVDLGPYESLANPGSYVPDLLSAISRAKDEVVDPAGYAALANRMAAAASDDAEREKAEKAQAVARVYAFYEDLLRGADAVDLGDLVYRAVLLLEGNTTARESAQTRHPHVLVDEFQDVNRASGRLLKAVAGAGQGLWVVGDPRQSIYRWRGASSANFDHLRADFPALRPKALKVNYRSRPSIVGVIEDIAASMRTASPEAFDSWEVYRGDVSGVVGTAVAPTMEAEALGLARALRERHSKGTRWRDQAVICRTHLQLERYARLLEREDIPVLYLGDMFARDEVRDLLALVSLTASGGWSGLVRVAAFPEYGVPPSDVARVLAWAAEDGRMPLQALADAAHIDGLSSEGAEGLSKLHSHLEGVHPNVPVWDFLSTYLFDVSAYLRRLPARNTVERQQKAFAIYQLLALAHGHRSREGAAPAHTRKSFLDYVRRLVRQSEDRQIRQVPEWADGIDAVRLLTVHASKGLEFEVVHVPALAKEQFPAGLTTGPCPPPDGLVNGDPKELHDEEEECLFFVAASRARDELHLSRAKKYLSKNRDPSTLLALAEGAIPTPPAQWDEQPEEESAPYPTVAIPVRDASAPFSRSELETYMECPRRYAYEYVQKVDAWAEPTPYLAYHRAVRKVIRHVHDERAQGRIPSAEDVRSLLDEAWGHSRLAESPYAARLRAIADRASELALDSSISVRPSWIVPLRNGDVTVSADTFTDGGAGVIVDKWRVDRLRKEEQDEDVYALLHEAAFKGHGTYTLRVVRPEEGEATVLEMTGAKRANRLEKYARAIDHVREGMFSPKPNSRACPRCPFYFVCPA